MSIKPGWCTRQSAGAAAPVLKTAAQLTTAVSADTVLSLSMLSLLAATVAVLVTSPAAVGVTVMLSLTASPGSMLPRLQVTRCPALEQPAGNEPIAKLSGRTSVTVTFRLVLLPDAVTVSA